MDIGSLLFLLALLLLVAAYILNPLRARHPHAVNHEDMAVSALMAERDRLLDALLELDFDHALNKVPEEIYPDQRNDLLVRAMDILRQLDEHAAGGDGDLSAQLEASIAAAKAVEGDDLEKMIAARKARKAKPATSGKTSFCPDCGQAVAAGDQFCTSCGTTL